MHLPYLTAAACATLLLPVAARAQSPGPTAPPHWLVRVEAGMASIHLSELTGPAGSLRLGRRLDRSGMLTVTFGLGGSSADAGFATADLGLEIQPPGHPAIAPSLGVKAGLLLEEGFAGEMLAVTAGFAYRLAPRQWLRVGGQLGRHGGVSGPHQVTLGFQRDF